MALKTTLNLEDSLLRRAKKLAADQGMTLTAFVEHALREILTRPPAGRKFRLNWTTVKGTQPPDFDIANRDALYDRMDGRI